MNWKQKRHLKVGDGTACRRTASDNSTSRRRFGRFAATEPDACCGRCLDAFMNKAPFEMHPFPDESIAIGCSTRLNEMMRRTDRVDDYVGIQLACQLGLRWWIWYPNGWKTGHFKTRDEALEWFENGGR